MFFSSLVAMFCFWCSKSRAEKLLLLATVDAVQIHFQHLDGSAGTNMYSLPITAGALSTLQSLLVEKQAAVSDRLAWLDGSLEQTQLPPCGEVCCRDRHGWSLLCVTGEAKCIRQQAGCEGASSRERRGHDRTRCLECRRAFQDCFCSHYPF